MYRSPPGARGFFIAIGLLGGAMIGAALVGLLAFWALQAAFPRPIDQGYPAYLALLFGAIVLIPILIWLGRRIPYLTDWYYLLPAITFLLAFTLFPIILTAYFAFTNFSAMRSGKPDRSTQAMVLHLEDRRLVVDGNAAVMLRCEQPDCAGEALEITNKTQRARVVAVQASQDTILLTAPPPFEPSRVYRINDYRFVGFQNFVWIFSQAGIILLPLLIWNIVFAAGAVVVGAIPGLTLGLILNNKNLALRGLYRTALIISWAIPAVISVQIFTAMLNVQFGPINRLLGLLGSYPVPWLTDPDWFRISALLIAMWIGFPYWMIATLGALSTIPEDVYEAAKIDGANFFQTLTGITLPLLRLPFIPLVLASFAFNFNNFGLIFLMGAQPPVEGRPATAQAGDILITWAYKTAFQAEGGMAYGLGGAISIIIFFLTVVISLINFRFTGALKEVR